MATAATRTSIINLVVLATNQAPGTTQLSTLIMASDAGQSLAQIAATLTSASTFTAQYPVFQTSEEFGKEFIDTIIPAASEAVRADAAALVATLLNSGSTRADILVASSDFLATAPTTDPSFGSAAATFQNKATVAAFHTVTLELDTGLATSLVGVTADAASVTAAQEALGTGASAGGSTFALTTGADAIVGGSGNDAINAAAGTLNSGDTINGGAGTDTLNITATGTAPAQTAASLSGVEIVNLTASPNPLSISMTGVTGVTAINNTNSANGATVTVSGVGAPVNSTLTGGQAATTIGYAAAVTGATAVTDAATLTLAGTALGASYTATGIDQLTVASTKAANTLSSLGVSTAATVTVTGDQALTINGTVGGSKLTTVDASAFTGTTLSLTAGNGVAGTANAGVAVTLPTAATVASTITTGTEKDTITLGAGNATVVAGGDNDAINAGVGTNTIMGGAGNDTIKLTGTKDTIRYAETGAANADTIEGFTSSTVVAVNLGTAKTATAAASADADFGVVQTNATSPTIGNVDGKGTGTAIVFQAVSATATTTSNPVAAGSNVLALNGAFTDGTAAGVVTALGTSATTAIETVAGSKFLIATYSVGNIAQVWAYNGDDDADTDIDASELALVATLSGVTQNSLTAANFATYLTAGTTAGTVSNVGQTINVSTPLNLINSTANANGDFLTAANDTVTVAQGMLPTGTSTATMGLTVIDPEGSSDADVLSATVLNQAWDSGTLISNIETVNLEFLTTDGNGFAMSSILPGTDTLNVSGLTATGNITNVISGTAFGIGSTYTNEIDIVQGATLAALTLNLNGGGSTTSMATFDVAQAVTALTVNANASTIVNLDTNITEFTGVTLKGSGNVTIMDVLAGIEDANITAGTDYTGTFTLRPTDTTLTALDFTEANEDVVGLDVLDLSVTDAWTGAAPGTITLPAVTTGGSFTVSHSPAATATLGSGAAADDLTVIQSGSSTADKLTLALGSKSTGLNGGDIVAASTDTLTITSAAASTVTTTITDITIASGAGTQSVTVSGAGIFSLGAINADTVNLSGIGKAATVADLTNAVGTTTVTGGNGGLTITASSGAANVNVTTGSGVDVINTGGGDDVISTGSGADTIDSGLGADSITTGGGSDKISFADVVLVANANTVTDFTAGAGGDVIQITVADHIGSSSGAGFAVASGGTAVTISTVANQTNTLNEVIVDTAANILAANFSGNAANDHNIAIASDTGAVYYDADGNYTAGAIQIGTLTITGTLVAANIDIIA